jgi:Uma2 family endonuclease
MRIRGAPDLVVEVLSPSTAKYDRGGKYEAYEKHAVREYWIIDPLHQTIEIWISGKGRKFDRKGSFSVEDSFDSEVLKQKVSAKEIFNG